MKKIISITILIIIASLTTCTYDVDVPTICFQEDVLPIFISNCTMSGCHNAKQHEAGYDLSNYEGIMKGVHAKHPLSSEIYDVIKGNNPSMPQNPYPKLTRLQVNTIRRWIQQGAQNTSHCSSCDTSNYTFSGRINTIVQTWCIGCHNATSTGGGYDFSTYKGVVAAITANRFLGSIQQTAGYSPMPQNSGQLSSCDITAIEKWILQGYPDN